MAPRTELCCRYLSAHQHSQHLLCLSLHNYTSWSCFLSPPDHLFPAANLQSVPASTLYNPPTRRVNLAVDMMLPRHPRSSPHPHRFCYLSRHTRTPVHPLWGQNRSVNECDSVTYKVSELLRGSVLRLSLQFVGKSTFFDSVGCRVLIVVSRRAPCVFRFSSTGRVKDCQGGTVELTRYTQGAGLFWRPRRA